MVRSSIFGFCICLLLFVGCKKDKTPTIVPTKTYPSSLVIGQSNATTVAINATTNDEIDIDGDGVNDFGFYGGTQPGGANSVIYGAKITPLHPNISVLIRSTTDTLFRGTLVRIEGTPPAVLHTTFDYIGQEMKPGTTFHESVQSIVADYKSLGDIFNTTNSFINESVQLNYHHVKQYYTTVAISGDTTYQEGFYHEAVGDFYGTEPYRFIGFKIITNSGEQRLGWIKLGITNHYMLTIEQVGLQNPE